MNFGRKKKCALNQVVIIQRDSVPRVVLCLKGLVAIISLLKGRFLVRPWILFVSFVHCFPFCIIVCSGLQALQRQIWFVGIRIHVLISLLITECRLVVSRLPKFKVTLKTYVYWSLELPFIVLSWSLYAICFVDSEPLIVTFCIFCLSFYIYSSLCRLASWWSISISDAYNSGAFD